MKHLKQSSFIANRVQLDFKDGDLLQPVIRDLFFSINALAVSEESKVIEDTIHIKANRIILEGETEVIIKSGEVKTGYHGKRGELETEAENISSTARSKSRINGGSVVIN